MTLLQSGVTKSSAAAAYTIDNSLRFNEADSAYLSRTPSVAGNRKTWTISFWVKKSKLDDADHNGILSVYGAGDNTGFMTLEFIKNTAAPTDGFKVGGWTSNFLITDQVFRDPSAWYHFVVACDTTDTTANDRIKLYVNGDEVTSFGTRNNPGEDDDTAINMTSAHHIGENLEQNDHLGGYLAEFYLIDGTKYAASDFGELDSTTNQWIPIDASGLTFGTNGFYQKYSTSESNTFIDSSSSAHTVTGYDGIANTRAQYKVGASSIVFDGTGDYLESPDSSDWDWGSSDFTIEYWVNYSTPSGNTITTGRATGFGGSSDNRWTTNHGTGGNVTFHLSNGTGGSAANTYTFSSTGLSLDDDAWHHIAFVRDGLTARIYTDGVQRNSQALVSGFTLQDCTSTNQIGRYPAYSFTQGFAGYLDEIRFSNTARYPDGTTFTPSTTEFVSDSNTKLLIHSDWDGGFGLDSSGEGNNFATTNLVATDQMVDTPTNNFCTLNPLAPANTPVTFSEGNLKVVPIADWEFVVGTIPMVSGKWYWELLAGGANTKVGILADDNDITAGGAASSNGILYYPSNKIIDNTWSSYGASFGDGDIIGYAVDMDGSTVTFYVNGATQGAISFSGSATTAQSLVPGGAFHTTGGTFNFGSDSSFAGAKTAQGNQDGNSKGDFYYAPPTDYLALCTDNLSAPEIALPGEYFNTLLYSGTGGSGQSLTGVGFQPEMMFLKRRDAGPTGWGAMDVVRGAEASSSLSKLTPNATTAQESSGDTYDVISFDSDGFTVGEGYNLNVNASGGTYATWNWKAGGAPTVDNSAGAAATPTAGSVKIDGANLGSALAGTIAATRLSANTTAGFSVVKWLGTDSGTPTVAHGLSVTPNLIITKQLDGTAPENWATYSTPTGPDGYINLDQTNAWSSNAGFFNDAPTASLFTPGSHVYVNPAANMIAYCFHSVEGYSKVGSYEGNNNVDGSFVYCGFKPALLLIKNIDSAGNNWLIFDDKRDTYNMVNETLFPDNTDAEATASTGFDFVSNGFKARSSAANKNQVYTYLYYAIAESPFKTSNAR